ncbi:DUF6512 family protein [Clostridium cibarium]|uniref:DUF6512 family protein n=1 Tax=Clostridium cibarium TaxID=2762247 RepID=UPI003C2CE14F
MKRIQNIILLGIPLIFILACIFHFLYDVTGKSTIAAIIFPINESIFEHLKLALYPTIFYWLFAYIINYKYYNINLSKWIIGCTCSLILNILIILSCYYIFKGAFNYSSFFLDICSILVSTGLGQLVSLHVYKNIHNIKLPLIISLILILSLIILFTFFTFNPPELPLFIDYSNG